MPTDLTQKLQSFSLGLFSNSTARAFTESRSNRNKQRFYQTREIPIQEATQESTRSDVSSNREVQMTFSTI